MKYFENEEQSRQILSADYIDRCNQSPMRDVEEIRVFFDEICEVESEGTE